MATEKEMYELIGRMVADPAFRASMVEDPEKAVKEAGYELTEEQMAALKERDLKALSADLDERLSKEAHWDFVGCPE
jgi:nucleoid-associated protein YejK